MPAPVQPLEPSHKARNFDCGYPELDLYIKQFARSNSQKGFGRTYVSLGENKTIRGYYTMSASNVPLSLWPEGTKGPTEVPTILLGRLAVSREFTGQGLGVLLLMHACERAVKVADIIGVHALEVVAIDERAKSFYLKHEFIPYQEDTLHLFIPIATLSQLPFDEILDEV